MLKITLIFYLVNFLNCEEPKTDIVLVQAIFRHGVRSILIDYPNDTFRTYWDKYGGYGQLTPVGMKQLYEYGIFFKNRYSNFLSPYYHNSKVFAKSTDYDRTIQSVLSFLSAVYKPSKDQEWNSNPNLSDYLPIPVRILELASDKTKCERYEELRNEMRSSHEYLALQAQNQEFLNLMIEKSGLTNLKNNQYMIWQIADKAMVEEAHNLPVDKYIQDNYNKIMEMNDHTFQIDFVTDEMGKLNSGGLLNEIVNNIKKKFIGSKAELFVYGVHDNNVAGMQKILNTSNKFVQPEFASGFVFELRKDVENNYYVQVFSKNNKFNEPNILSLVKVNGCDELCPLNKFLNLTSNKLVTNFKEICQAKFTGQNEL
ncbi:unnamed protein product [Brachionus calyciflorus]|uniref:acid phosphatase n=1 Tax=Brachionus calyciflorus TaxID=104777 RepID=A0A813RVD0_9BILA|nr:unnamed protein product [Brachionus calyciflorus]